MSFENISVVDVPLLNSNEGKKQDKVKKRKDKLRNVDLLSNGCTYNLNTAAPVRTR